MPKQHNERQIEVLNDWFLLNLGNPFPDGAQIRLLSIITKLKADQIYSFFANKRRSIKNKFLKNKQPQTTASDFDVDKKQQAPSKITRVSQQITEVTKKPYYATLPKNTDEREFEQEKLKDEKIRILEEQLMESLSSVSASW